MKSKGKKKRKQWVSLWIVMCLIVTMAAGNASFVNAAVDAKQTDGYALHVSVDQTEVLPGETVSLAAEVTYNGEVIADLSAAGLKLWWWTDVWAEGHTDGLNDAVYSNNDNNSGNSLTADVTLPSVGTYYVVAELKTDDTSLYKAVVTFAVTEKDETDTDITGAIDVKKISNLSEDFIMGMDISSVIAEFNSGVTFKDFDGNTIDNVTDFCKFLRSCGITHIRVRVWNDPYDTEGNGYGGGNNDIATATEIAKACAAADLKMLVDFHYSDFWADPGKQQAPKAWSGYSLEEKMEAMKSFTIESLQTIAATGVDIDMVQVGNETTNAFIGETGDNYGDMCKLFQAGSEAIRAFDENIKVVIHFTNPERTNQLVNWAKRLSDHGVDYDVLATSYYPYWHGTLENLKNQFKTVQETYGKDVMVAETSYAYSLDDTDGHDDNTVRQGKNDSVTSYPFSPQGQADCIRDIMAAVNEAGGLGVYYWEPAWITVGDTTGLTGDAYDAQVSANKKLWESQGSGWASSYATEYDPEDAGKWFGGSAVENQAMFYPDGTPTESLHVWEYVKTGATSNTISIEAIQNIEDSIEAGGVYDLPATVSVTYNKGTVDEAVIWNAEDVAKIDTSKPGVYVVNGEVSLSKNVNTGDYADASSAAVTYTLTVKEKNLITDKDAAGFEYGDVFVTEGEGIKPIPSKEDVLEGNGTLHWYNPTAADSSVTYTEPITLEAGWYTLEACAMGFAGDTVTLKVLDMEGNVLFEGDPAVLNGWTTVLSECERTFVTFHIENETQVKLQVSLGISDGGWGSVDALYLHAHQTISTTDNGDGTQTVNCDDCDETLGVEEVKKNTPKDDADGEKTPDDNSNDTKVQGNTTNTTSSTKNTSSTTQKQSSVKTGDMSNGTMYVVLMAACLCVIIAMFTLKKKQSK